MFANVDHRSAPYSTCLSVKESDPPPSLFPPPQVLVLRLRDSVVRMGEELEQAAQAEARERENAQYYQHRLADMRLEMEDLTQREQESSRRRMELVRAAGNTARPGDVI